MFVDWTIDTSSVFEALNLKNLATWICSSAMIFGGVVPYIPQYREIWKTDNADGFSSYVCLVLLIANTLRIVFWFGHPYEFPLLFQSITMIIAMLAMMHLCIKVRNKTVIVPAKSRLFADFDARYFWEWTDFLSYLEFMATFTAMMGILIYFCIEIFIIVETIGFLAVFIEAMLGAPQFYRNLRKKSTFGMSKKMVFLWTFGDIFKTVYFVVREAPVQFWMCGILQVFIDFLILLQVLIYRGTPSPVKLLLKGESHTS
ncbi:solute carrier family 66 member 2-like isoform X2 [Stegodyphus dumicola]|uniref:solute carrier family 66 member 2-like isoform X2 n=1 Tax=Stegodyphus dumicola TaxID=202533 RepID=UPI0015B3399A|nr:solute carrier family 66 member 2-like isoform X2 [Stegodyphus dumicola]